MNLQGMTLIMIPDAELQSTKASLKDIKQQLNNLNPNASTSAKYLTAIEFMTAVRIKRTKFDETVRFGRITIVKNRRKIDVPVEEVDRYFIDPSVK